MLCSRGGQRMFSAVQSVLGGCGLTLWAHETTVIILVLWKEKLSIWRCCVICQNYLPRMQFGWEFYHTKLVALWVCVRVCVWMCARMRVSVRVHLMGQKSRSLDFTATESQTGGWVDGWMTGKEEGVVSELSGFIDSCPGKERDVPRVKANATLCFPPL